MLSTLLTRFLRVLAFVSVDEARLLDVLGGNGSCPDIDVMLELFLG